MGELRDGATAQYAYPETVLIFQHCFAFLVCRRVFRYLERVS
jgi:hypothetical protein